MAGASSRGFFRRRSIRGFTVSVNSAFRLSVMKTIGKLLVPGTYPSYLSSTKRVLQMRFRAVS